MKFFDIQKTQKKTKDVQVREYICKIVSIFGILETVSMVFLTVKDITEVHF